MSLEEHKELIKKHYEEYKKIGYVRCPAFDGEKVYFNKKGFRHLIYKNNDRRSNSEYKTRLELLKYSSDIVYTSKQYKEFRKAISDKGLINFWSLEKRFDGKDIILIIQQFENKPKQFFSIMYKK